MFGKGILSGKKTYIVATTGLFTAIGAYLYGGIDMKELIEALFIAVGAFTMRQGIEKSGPAE